ncbi:MAG: hypothetical protein K6F07_01225 [Bacilli bacterium]|nr:hypothetical protein [Bacilli bacterium]
MNKTSRVFYIVGAILGFVTALVFLIVGIVYLVFSIKAKQPTDMSGLESYLNWAKAVNNMAGQKLTSADPYGLTTLDASLKANLNSGITFIVLSVLLIPAGVVALVASHFQGRNLPIHIVAAVLNFDSLALVGAVLGIISAAMNLGKKETQQPAE